MSLADISSASLKKIFQFMNIDPRNVDSLRQSCKLFNQQAISLGLQKVDNVYLRLAIESRKFRQFPTGLMGKDLVIRAMIKMRKPVRDPDCDACNCKNVRYFCEEHEHKAESDSDEPMMIWDGYYAHVTDSESSGKEDTFKIGSDRRKLKRIVRGREIELDSDPEYYENEDDSYFGTERICTCKSWFVIAMQCWETKAQKSFKEVFPRLLKRVNSIDKLNIKCWRINDDAMKFLSQQDPLRSLKKLVLFNCHLHVEKDTFHGLLANSQLREVMLNCKYTKYRPEDEFLFHMNKVELIGLYGKNQRVFAGLTDNLLALWQKKPPTLCKMNGFRTKFTMDGMVGLIEALHKVSYEFNFWLDTPPLDRNACRTLMDCVQRKRKLAWDFFRKPSGSLSVTVIYPNGSQFAMDIKQPYPTNEPKIYYAFEEN